MSSTSSAVTYTSVYTDSKPGRVFWGVDEELSDGGSSRVIVYGYDGLPMLPVAPPSPDYILGPEETQTPPAPQDEDEHKLMFIQPYDLDFMPEPIYPEYIPLEDEHILLAEEHPLPPVVSPTAESPRYVTESDPKEDPKEYEEDETEDGPVDYPIDGGDDGDDDDDDSSGYDVDDEDEDEDEEGEEEEHLAPADSTMVIPIDELVSPPKGTGPTIPPPSTDTTTIGARITIRPQTSISLPTQAKVERLLAMPTPSPLTSLSPPFIGERLARCTAPAALPLPLLIPFSYPPPPVDRRDGIPESEHPPRKRLCLSTLSSRYEMRHRGIREVGYGIRDTWIDLAEAVSDMASTTLEKVAMDSQRVDLLMGDRITLQETVWIVKEEAYPAREAWAQMIGDSLSDERHETRDGRHAGRVVSTTWTAKESRTARRGQWSNLDFRSRGLCNHLGSAQEEDDGQFVANENKKIDKYISGLPDNIYGNVKSSKPRTLDETIELTYDLMDQKFCTYAERADNKRKTGDTSRNNHRHEQQPFKNQNVTKVYNIGTRERKPYEGSLPKCRKCQHHHNGPCTQKCHKCNKVGHFARDCRSSGNANVANAQRDGEENPKGNGCFECRASGHFKRDCPKLKNKNEGNRNAQGWVYAVGNTKKNGMHQ
nr:hypothetical protein [Tanacetum cinerariifolium]